MNERIVSDSSILGGVPCIKGTRLPAALIGYLVINENVSKNEVMSDYKLSSEDVDAAIEFARRGE